MGTFLPAHSKAIWGDCSVVYEVMYTPHCYSEGHFSIATIMVVQGKHFIIWYQQPGPIPEAGIMFTHSGVFYNRWQHTICIP